MWGCGNKSSQSMSCRHVVAARLAEKVMSDKLKSRTVDEDQFVEIIASMD